MKSILRLIAFIAVFFVGQQLLLILIQYFIRDFELCFFLSNLIVSLAIIPMLIQLKWFEFIVINNVSVKILLLYALFAIAYVLLYQLLSKHEISFSFDRNIYRVLSVILIAPIIEEIIFRGIAIEYLSKHSVSKYYRILFTTVIFGLVHLPFWSIFDYHIFLFGLIVALIYEKERNVTYCIIFHAVANVLFVFN